MPEWTPEDERRILDKLTHGLSPWLTAKALVAEGIDHSLRAVDTRARRLLPKAKAISESEAKA